MKKIFILLFVLIGFVGCIDSLLPLAIRPYGLYLQEEHFVINPEKSVYKVGDTININIVFPKHLMAEYGEVKELKPNEEKYFGYLFRPKSYNDSIDFFINGVKIFQNNDNSGLLNFEYTGNNFLLKEKVQLVFKEEGEYFFKELVRFHMGVNYYQSVSTQEENLKKSFKVEP